VPVFNEWNNVSKNILAIDGIANEDTRHKEDPITEK
jgi:hypothetical protein